MHTLRVQYPLALPDSQLGGSYLPALDWSAGPRLRFVFGLSDLNRARYAEAWLPANLIYDQYAIELDIASPIPGRSSADHERHGHELGPNLEMNFPARFTALSPMLELRAADTLEHRSATCCSGIGPECHHRSLEARPVARSTSEINRIGKLLSENEIDYGGYVHANRFVAFFNGSGGMEYEGGTTTSASALEHETSTVGMRGVKPASQADGWWDEGCTKFHDDGANDVIPFDFANRRSFSARAIRGSEHAGKFVRDGNTFWKGIASIIGVGTLNNLMGDLYDLNKGNPLSTQMIEEFLLCKSGNPDIVDAFHRFVYGLGNPSPIPDLWLQDDTADPGAGQWRRNFLGFAGPVDSK